METKNESILALFSDVDFSPQLISILYELHNRKADLHVILIGESDARIAEELMASKWNFRVIKKTGKFGSLFHFFVMCFCILRIQPQVVFTSGQFATVIGMVSAKVCRVPQRIFIRHHSNFHHKYNMKFGVFLDHVTNSLSTDIVAVSAVVRSILISKENVDSKKIKLIYNGINLDRFQKMDSIRHLDYGKGLEQEAPFTIGVISRLTDVKGVQYTATAFVKLQGEFPNTRLHIVGAFADSYKDIIDILKPLNPNVYLIENKNSDIPNFYHNIDVFVHVPTGSDDEAFGIVYIEALASGVSCIFTKSGILNELESLERYVAIVPYRSSDDIYSKLKESIQGSTGARTDVPSQWIDQFSELSVAQQYSNLILDRIQA
jgi:glycosyltransferase involved in cell wall biosynthesis